MSHRTMSTFGLLVLGLGLAARSSAAQPSPPAPDAPAAARAFAAFHARDLQGRTITADSLRGKIVVLDFWATWCAPCLAEVPTLQRLLREHDPDRVAIVGVSLDVLDRRSLVAWLRRQQVTWTQIHDGRGYNGDLPRRFGIAVLPTTYVFDAEGRLAATNVRGERLLRTVAALSASRSAPSPR